MVDSPVSAVMAHNVDEAETVEGTDLEWWMRQLSVDDRLEQLLGLYNTRVLVEGPGLQYTRQRMPVSGKLVCNFVHSDLHADRLDLYRILEDRLSWEGNARTAEGDLSGFVDFLRDHIPRPRGADRAPRTAVEWRRFVLHQLKGKRRSDRCTIHKHVPTVFRELAGRADAVDKIAEYVTDGADTPATDRIANPIIASVASMGVGKTELLLSLPTALAVHHTSKAWMQNAVPIFITFNGKTPREVDAEIDVEEAAARRILFAHFAEKMGYADFNRVLGCHPVGVQNALECVLEDMKELREIEHPSVLLCIDELMKCGTSAESHPEATQLLAHVGAAMDGLGEQRPVGRAVVTVVTSLRRSAFVRGQTDSFRPIHWVPLEALLFDDCLRLVSTYVANTGGLSNLTTHPWFRGMVALCSGHPRSLNVLALALGKACRRRHRLEDPKYRVKVLEEARDQFGATVCLPDIDTLALLQHAVAGATVALEDKVGNTTVETLIASGIFINAGTPLNRGTNNDVVPAMSMLLMAHLPSLPLHVEAAVEDFMVSACHPDLWRGGSAFEALHTAVEVLKRAVLVNGEASPPVRLDELFQHTMKPKKLPEWWENTEVRFKVPRWCATKEREHLHYNFDNVVAGRDKIPEPQGGDVIVPDATNNPGCDRVFVDDNADGEGRVITFMEARYTTPRSGEMRRAPASALQADLATKFETLTQRAVGEEAKLPQNAKFVSLSVLHRRYDADKVQDELDSARAADLAARWPHDLVRVVHTYDTLCKFYPPTFRHIPDLLTPGAAPADGIKSCSGGTTACNLSASPAPRSASAGPLSSPVRHLWRFGRAGPRLRAAATMVGVALVSGFAWDATSRRKVQ